MDGAVEILKREREAAQEQIRVLRARLRDLDAAIGLLEGQPAATRAGRSEGDLKPRVLQVLQDRPQEGSSPKEIATALTAAGRVTSDASVSSTLSRLKADGKVRNQHGTWFAVSNGESANLSATRNLSESMTRQQPDDERPPWDDPADIPF